MKSTHIKKIAYPFVAIDTMIAMIIIKNVKGFFLTELAESFGNTGYLNLLTISRESP